MKMSDNVESPTETHKEEPHTPSDDSTTSDDKKKIDVLLKAVGDAPIMKTKKWAVERGRTVQSLSQFISRFLKLDTSEQLGLMGSHCVRTRQQKCGGVRDERQGRASMRWSGDEGLSAPHTSLAFS
uniref:Ubiquitin-like protein ATG12 n=1 Tax=Gasterosteus aculeatus aculeatus TaxID=481459 RepID=A0AAQ4P097_GASAC